MLGVSILPLSMILLLDFGTVPTVWFIVFHHIFVNVPFLSLDNDVNNYLFFRTCIFISAGMFQPCIHTKTGQT